MPCLRCCRSAVEDALKGFAVLTALGGLAVLLGGLHALLPLGAAATDGVAWFAWCLVVFGGLLLALGAAAATGSWCSLAAPMHCYTGATLALLPLQGLLAWACAEHPSELRRLADRDQTYCLSAILDWCDAHGSLAAGLAGLWLVLQAAAAALGSVYACCPARRQAHAWNRWGGDEESRDALLPRQASPRAAGYHTPPSRFQSPYTSPARHPTSGPLMAVAAQAAAPPAATAVA